MPNSNQATLRLRGSSPLLATDAAELLIAMNDAYSGAVALIDVLTDVEFNRRRWRRDFPFEPVLFGGSWQVFYPQPPMSFMDASQALVLHKVKLTSPGFWEFMGSLNGLDVLRKFLDDRHRRRQDREYRETSERRRLELENDLLEGTVIQQRIDLARQAGIPETEIRRLFNQWLVAPAERLDAIADVLDITPGELEAENEHNDDDDEDRPE